MIDIKVLRAMAASGATVDVIIAAVEAQQVADAEKSARRREQNRIAKRNQRSRHADKSNVSICQHDIPPPSPPPSMVSPITPSLTTPTSSPSKSIGRARATPLPDDFNPPVDKAVQKLGRPREWVEAETMRFKNNALAKDCRYVDWVKAWWNWLTSPFQNGANGNGHGRSGTFQEDRSASRAAGRLLEKARNGEFTFGPRPLPPGTLPDSDEDDAGVLAPRRRN